MSNLTAAPSPYPEPLLARIMRLPQHLRDPLLQHPLSGLVIEYAAAQPEWLPRRLVPEFLARTVGTRPSPRTVEAFEVPTMRLGGRAMVDALHVLAFIHARMVVAPVVMGG